MIPKLYLEDPPNGMSEIICLFLERKYMLGVISVKVQKPVSAHRSFLESFSSSLDDDGRVLEEVHKIYKLDHS